ncbi:hypothetical protein BDR22DRAFT_817614 [Usnea florida]
MLRTLKLHGAAIAAVLSMTDTCLGLDPRLVKSSLASASLLLNRESGGSCPNVQPLEGSKDAVFYNNGASDGCPIIHKVDSNKDCTDGLNTQGSISTCSSYCEQKVEFFYGPESVFTQFPQCRANEACSFTTTDTKTITNSYSFNLGSGLKARSSVVDTLFKREDESVLKPSFDVVRMAHDRYSGLEMGTRVLTGEQGATYDYSVSSSIAKGLILSRPTTEADQCGHWTFVPIMWKSCGVMTTSDFTPELAECDTTSQTMKSDASYCNTTPYLDNNGNQAGEAIFVLVNCSTNELLPMSKQDPIYQRPGVCATC